MDKKIEQLKCFQTDPNGKHSTTNFGVPISNDENTLKAGPRGPALLEDFVFREKMTHFDHERIPERIVHARGSGAHGFFISYGDQSKLTKANFLSQKDKKTPVFARFSTVQGPRGSPDTVRDIRGFAVKFYTDEGNFDIVGNNAPVFFVQDAISFPDFVHAVKMEQHNEMPTAASAHDTFYDYVSLKTESAHAVMWALSDRAIPLSFRHMEGFGVHSYRLINAQGKSTFIKWFWKPLSGACSLVWDEAQKIAGKNSDYHRKRLWDDIEAGDYPQWELNVQILSDEIQEKFEFDILDPTKFIPEELAPLHPVGRMVLNKNPDNFFAETEQVAFCVSHVVPGVDFSNDPLLQGRIFSYLDTQLIRLGGPNFNQIPINRPVCPYANTQRDGYHCMDINKGNANYFPNSIDGNYPRPKEESPIKGGFCPYPEKIDAVKGYKRSESFEDHFSQASMYYNSLSQHEKNHVVGAFSFELSKVTRRFIVERFVNEFLFNVDKTLAEKVGKNLGVTIEPKMTKHTQKKLVKPSPALSLENLLSGDIISRRIAVLIFNGCDTNDVMSFKKEIEKRGAHIDLLAPSMAPVKGCDGPSLTPKGTWISEPSVLYDAVYVPTCDDEAHDLLVNNGEFLHYILEAYKHLKTIAVSGCPSIIKETLRLEQDLGLILGQGWRDVIEAFTYSLAHHRVWAREEKALKIPA